MKFQPVKRHTFFLPICWEAAHRWGMWTGKRKCHQDIPSESRGLSWLSLNILAGNLFEGPCSHFDMHSLDTHRSVWNSDHQHTAKLKDHISLHRLLCRHQEVPENYCEISKYSLGNNHIGITGNLAWFILWQPNEWGQSATGKALLIPMKLEKELIWSWKPVAMCHFFTCRL